MIQKLCNNYPGGQAFTATGAFGRAFKSELIVELAFSVFELHEPWANPYFDTGQRLTQNAVTVAGAQSKLLLLPVLGRR